MKHQRNWPTIGLLLLLAITVARLIFPPAYSDQLGQRSMQLNSNQVSSATDYRLTFDLSTAGTLGSIRIQFCANDPFPETACVPPAGFDAGPAVLATQTGPGGFSIDGASTANEIILSRPPLPAVVGSASYHFTGVVNPSAPGSYYSRVLTYVTNDASGPASDYGGIAFAITDDLSVAATVPPYLIFCSATTIGGLNCANANGNFIDFGELSFRRVSSGSSQLLVSTNAEVGYNVTISGTTLTSGNNILNALSGNDVSRPGTSQFGLNLRGNSSPGSGSDPVGPGSGSPTTNYNQPNSFRFVAGEIVISKPTPDNIRKYTVSYIANVPSVQPPGVYVSTITYVCLANF